MNEGRRCTSIRQLELILDFLERHQEVALGRVRSKEARAVAARVWRECAEILNAEGPARTGKEWAKVWNDQKCRVRAKLVSIHASKQASGGPCTASALTPLEERVANILRSTVGLLAYERQDQFDSNDRTERHHENGWDNLKNRNTSILTLEEQERVKTGGDAYRPGDRPQTGKEETITDEDLVEQTDAELSVDSDNAQWMSGDTQLESQPPPPPVSSQSDGDTSRTSLEKGSKNNKRRRVIEDGQHLRQAIHKKKQINKLMVQEKEWLVKAAQETYKKARIERQAAEELLLLNRAKRLLAESELNCIDN